MSTLSTGAKRLDGGLTRERLICRMLIVTGMEDNGLPNALDYPAYVYWKNDLTFLRVSEESDWLHLFEISDVLWESLYGWDSSGRHFALKWDEKEARPKPFPGQSDLAGFRTAVEFYSRERQGVSYPEPFFGISGQEVSPAKMDEVLINVENKTTL